MSVPPYNNPSSASSENGQPEARDPLTYNRRPETFEDVGIVIPSDAAGEVSTTCPECSHTRHKSRDPCLSINVTDGLWYCHHCGWTGGLRRQGYYPRRSARRALPGSAAPQPTRPSPDAEAKAKAKAENDRKYLIATWHEAQPITADDPVGRYFTRRGVWPKPVPKSLRYHANLLYYHDDGRKTYHPTLVAAIQEPSDLVISLHRIYLTSDGYKADVPKPKKFMSATTTVDGVAIATSMNGAAIRIDQATDKLVVTEGIETALAVRLMTGMPTWAALSATGMAKLWVPKTVRLVVIAADHDPHGKGQEAAHKLRDRLLQQGRQVKILIPETPGSDWADALVSEEGAYHA